MADNHEIYGWRFIDRFYNSRPQIGDKLPHSYHWDGDERTDVELRGASAFSSRQQLQDYAKYSHGCGWVVQVGGEHAGNGELGGEILIKNAVVISCEEW